MLLTPLAHEISPRTYAGGSNDNLPHVISWITLVATSRRHSTHPLFLSHY
jgi:hypothetical protein